MPTIPGGASEQPRIGVAANPAHRLNSKGGILWCATAPRTNAFNGRPSSGTTGTLASSIIRSGVGALFDASDMLEFKPSRSFVTTECTLAAIYKPSAIANFNMVVATSSSTDAGLRFQFDTNKFAVTAGGVTNYFSGVTLTNGVEYFLGFTIDETINTVNMVVRDMSTRTVSTYNTGVVASSAGDGVGVVGAPSTWPGYGAGGDVSLAFIGNKYATLTELTQLALNPWALFEAPNRRLVIAAASTGIVALTGVSGTGAVGTPLSTRTVALTGNATSVAVGTVVPTRTVALTGQATAVAVGTVAPVNAVALTGSAAAVAVGSVSTGLVVALTGVSAAGAVGTVTANAGGDVTAAITGVSGVGAVGTVAPVSSVALTGVSGTGAVGTVVPASSVALTGNTATGEVGSVAVVGGDVVVALTGVQAVGTVGTVRAVGADSSNDSSGGGFPMMPQRRGKKYEEFVREQRIALGIVAEPELPESEPQKEQPTKPQIAAVKNELRAFRKLADQYEEKIEQKRAADIGTRRKAQDVARLEEERGFAIAHAEQVARDMEEMDVVFVALMLLSA